MRLVEFRTVNQELVHLNPETVVAVVGEDTAASVTVLTACRVAYEVQQESSYPVRKKLTGERL